MAFLALFMHEAITIADKIPATFGLGSLYCQVLALVFHYVADYHLSKKAEFKPSAPKPKRHFTEWSDSTWYILFGVAILALVVSFMGFIFS